MGAEFTTVYVDAVCDLFHAGHVAFFEKARSLGSRLIVGLVSDANVATYKRIPVLSLAERAAVVRACRLVDEVIPDPPLFCSCAFLDAIKADVVCHGDDMSDEELSYWYSDPIAHGRFRKIGYTSGISTREIIARVAERIRESSDGQPS